MSDINKELKFAKHLTDIQLKQAMLQVERYFPQVKPCTQEKATLVVQVAHLNALNLQMVQVAHLNALNLQARHDAPSEE